MLASAVVSDCVGSCLERSQEARAVIHPAERCESGRHHGLQKRLTLMVEHIDLPDHRCSFFGSADCFDRHGPFAFRHQASQLCSLVVRVDERLKDHRPHGHNLRQLFRLVRLTALLFLLGELVQLFDQPPLPGDESGDPCSSTCLIHLCRATHGRESPLPFPLSARTVPRPGAERATASASSLASQEAL